MSPPPPPQAAASPGEDLGPSADPHPGYFALVMATGIVSIACERLEFELVARALLVLNGVFFSTLWVAMLRRALRFPRAFVADFSDHARGVGFFTWAAGPCVLAVQCLVVYPLPTTALGLWALGTLLWALLTYGLFAALTVKRDKPDLATGLHGGWLVAVVATQAVSVASVHLASVQPDYAVHLLFFALVTWLSGGMLYLWLISLIFYRCTFVAMEPLDLTPTYWINMGAVAISTLAGSLLVGAASRAEFLQDLLPFLRGGSLLFWATATWWIPLLLVLGAWRHVYRRFPLRYGPAYWGAVFPLGMYTVCTAELASALDLDFLVWIPGWTLAIALGAWLLTFLAMCRALLSPRSARGELKKTPRDEPG